MKEKLLYSLIEMWILNVEVFNPFSLFLEGSQSTQWLTMEVCQYLEVKDNTKHIIVTMIFKNANFSSKRPTKSKYLHTMK